MVAPIYILLAKLVTEGNIDRSLVIGIHDDDNRREGCILGLIAELDTSLKEQNLRALSMSGKGVEPRGISAGWNQPNHLSRGVGTIELGSTLQSELLEHVAVRWIEPTDLARRPLGNQGILLLVDEIGTLGIGRISRKIPLRIDAEVIDDVIVNNLWRSP